MKFILLFFGAMFIPNVGMFYSQPGNVLFPMWELSASILFDCLSISAEY